MKYNYSHVDSTNLTVGTLLNGMDANAAHLQGLIKQLEAVFTGMAADVANPLMNKFRAELGDAKEGTGYQGQLAQVRAKIGQTSGSEGFMRETDSAQGARFLSIG
ncbi:hypothetical protein AB0H00_30315 [Nocardia sp. NPDC023852]|uniref:hypothetical protein n=1 Tax=Nocardia sp. NPDC023852 TaxID=3154697 RepID=UPI0033FD900D